VKIPKEVDKVNCTAEVVYLPSSKSFSKDYRKHKNKLFSKNKKDSKLLKPTIIESKKS
jgi:hypothetical protein